MNRLNEARNKQLKIKSVSLTCGASTDETQKSKGLPLKTMKLKDFTTVLYSLQWKTVLCELC